MEIIIFTREGEKRKEEYREYLHTEDWRQFRRHIFEIYPYCLYCKKADPQDNTHHLTYERRGHERDEDVVRLDKKCHYDLHDKKIPIEPILKEQQYCLERARQTDTV